MVTREQLTKKPNGVYSSKFPETHNGDKLPFCFSTIRASTKSGKEFNFFTDPVRGRAKFVPKQKTTKKMPTST
ncbi:MAG: hypothetical protein NPIRA03_22700 [Nitrospirales bacterium]|nr:MAG: hypothetical protein NPIRA03_22700 [Nitrospirales bacterium]